MPSKTEAARARAAASVERTAEPRRLDQRTIDMIDALQRERTGYVTRGLDDRAAQVDEQITVLRGGH